MSPSKEVNYLNKSQTLKVILATGSRIGFPASSTRVRRLRAGITCQPQKWFACASGLSSALSPPPGCAQCCIAFAIFLHGRVDHHHQQPLTYCNGKATCPTIPPLVQRRVSTSDRRGRPGGGQVRKTPRDMLGLSIKRNCWSAGSIINKLNANHSKDSLTKW